MSASRTYRAPESQQQFRWKAGARARGLKAQEVGEYIEHLVRKHGGAVTPEKLLKSARRKSSLLHDFFEWDDEIAAHKHRLDQARYLIRSVEVVFDGPEEDDEPHVVRAFIDDPGDDAEVGDFLTITDILADPARRKRLLARAFKELEAWRQRHQDLVELSEVFSAVDKAVRERR